MSTAAGCGTVHSRVSCVAQWVVSQAAATPSALALASASGALTYAELDSRSSVLADLLRAAGVGPDVVVGLLTPRSPAMVVAALGILKSGGAYLPLDPTYPRSRLAFILDDSEVPVLMAGDCVKDRLPPAERPTILLDELGRVVHSPFLPQRWGTAATIDPKNLAYVIYTSGSTGRPKGVEITHESHANLVRWHQQAFEVTPADRASQVARVGFDAAVWEVWPYLAAGASLHIPEEETVGDPERLRDWLVAEAITISFAPTPMAERLLTLPWPAKTALRTMLTGGDTLHGYPRTGLPFQLVNNYGPTECTVVATSCPVFANGSTDRLPPIGRPILNTQVYILDEAGKQVPVGRTGELHIGGAGLGRGYRSRPELTAERFVANPFDGSSRLFKTGDLARMLPDGQIAFMGRGDEQVKVRGFRVEPNEVAAALNEHPAVAQSVVVAHEFSAGDKRLIGYFVAALRSKTTPAELREFLGKRLPDFMVPAAFVKLETLPLTAHGKVDRAALPAPDDTNVLRDAIFTAPHTNVERRVAGILARLLEVERVDVEDNFISLGGHSLLGAQLVARLRDAFGIDVALRVVFDAQTVAALSSEVERLLSAKSAENGGNPG